MTAANRPPAHTHVMPVGWGPCLECKKPLPAELRVVGIAPLDTFDRCAPDKFRTAARELAATRPKHWTETTEENDR